MGGRRGRCRRRPGGGAGDHVGPAHRPFRQLDKDAQPAQVFPATGKQFASTQTHWFRVADGKVIEHWADRDDLCTATQLGWTPSSPWYIVRMLLASRRARRDARRHQPSSR